MEDALIKTRMTHQFWILEKNNKQPLCMSRPQMLHSLHCLLVPLNLPGWLTAWHFLKFDGVYSGGGVW